jgi:hypothetical protein
MLHQDLADMISEVLLTGLQILYMLYPDCTFCNTSPLSKPFVGTPEDAF